MDSLSASLIEYSDTAKEIKSISAELNDSERERFLQKGETNVLDSEQDLLLKYYQEIGEAIMGYPQVVLFGPTTAKNELQTILSHDKHFAGVDIILKITEKLNHNEQVDFVNDYYYINA